MSTPSTSITDLTDLEAKQHLNTQVGATVLYGVPIVSLVIDGKERLCLAQISNTLLKLFSYNEIHNRRVALGITCVQCTPVQLEILRRAGAMPISSRRCGMVTKREAERLVKSFLEETKPPRLPETFTFAVQHRCGWGCAGAFSPARYNSSRAKCVKCSFCGLYFSPNKFIFHYHRTPESTYQHPDAANFNSWRRHLHLQLSVADEAIESAWEDVKAMFNGGSRKRVGSASTPEQAPPAPKKERSSSSGSGCPKATSKSSNDALESLAFATMGKQIAQSRSMLYSAPDYSSGSGPLMPFTAQKCSSPPSLPLHTQMRFPSLLASQQHQHFASLAARPETSFDMLQQAAWQWRLRTMALAGYHQLINGAYASNVLANIGDSTAALGNPLETVRSEETPSVQVPAAKSGFMIADVLGHIAEDASDADDF